MVNEPYADRLSSINIIYIIIIYHRVSSCTQSRQKSLTFILYWEECESKRLCAPNLVSLREGSLKAPEMKPFAGDKMSFLIDYQDSILV